MPSAFDEEMRILEKWKKKDIHTHRKYADWRRKWRISGPVAFTYGILKVDPETGKPISLSGDQKGFLDDITKKGIRLAIIVAGRGAGKTFILAIYTIWRIFTHEFWGISCMGGSAEQSEKIHKYISYWVRECPDLREYCVKCTSKKVVTHSNGEALFLSCSQTSVRGPHTHELIIDEQAAGEAQGKDKRKAIKAALFQVSTSPDIHIIKSSTAQFVHGDFLDTLNNAKKMGYKKYRWSIAKHINGITNPYQIYQDCNPENWKSNVPWILDRNIKILRNSRSNDEWLVEALGGVSRASGLLFNPAKLDACICRRCPDEFKKPCKPYEEGYCPIIQYYMQLEGIPPKKIPRSVHKALTKVKQRVEGLDWGKNSPCAYTVTGKLKTMVFILHSEEEVGASDGEKVQKGVDTARDWHVEILRPDPREWAYNNELAAQGFAVHQLFTSDRGDREKNKMVYVLKRFVERGKLLIPCVFEDLIRSMKNISYSDDGKIRKRDDHSFDSLIYAISYYGELADQTAFWEAVKAKTPAEIRKTESEEERKVREAKEEKNLKRSGSKDVEVIDDWNKWIEKKKWEKTEESDEEEFPWGEGVDLW